MNNLTKEFIEWVLSEYNIKLIATPSSTGETFKDFFPDLYFLFQQEKNNE